MEKELRFKKKFMTDGRKTGVLLILMGVGFPLILSFFQSEGAFRFFSSSMIAERTLTPLEIKAVKAAVDEKKNGLDEVQKAVALVKEAYREQMGENYFKDIWRVRKYHGFIIPFKYAIAIGLLLALIGLGKFILG